MRWLAWTWLALSACDRPAPGPLAAAPEELAPGARDRGRRIFLERCVLCHGAAADGHGARAFALDRSPPNLGDAAWRRRRDAASVRRAIEDGVRGTAMPAWGPVLGGQAIDDLTAYVLSIARLGP